MTSSDGGESTGASDTPASQDPAPRLGYGNIYTPHAGSMIIQVQRESGLQSRTIVFSARQVRFLRFATSRTGKIFAVAALAVLLAITAQAARVPALTREIGRMEHTATRLDTLERSLTTLQRRYDQVRAILGADSATTAHRASGENFATAASLPAPAASVVPSSAPLGDSGVAGGPVADRPAVTPPRTRTRRRRAAAPPPEPVPDSAPKPDSAAAPNPQAEPQ